MKKIIFLLPLVLSIMSCVMLPAPTQVSSPAQPTAMQVFRPTAEPTMLSATTTPIASDSHTPVGTITYFWPLALPEGFVLSLENSRADEGGFMLTFINSDQGKVLRLVGGTEADDKYCISFENNPSEPVTVRGQEGCFPAATGGGFAVDWKENGTHYTVGGMSLSKEFALATAEQLESIDLSTFLARLVP